MDYLINDLIKYIAVKFLDRKSIINWLSICKKFRKLFFEIYLSKFYIKYNDFLDNYLINNGKNDIIIFYKKYYNQIYSINIKNNYIKLCINVLSENISKNIPKNINILVLRRRYYDHSLKYLPDNIKVIIFTGSFNQSINNLPDSILNIKIYSKCFRQDINKLPNNLKILQIEECDAFVNIYYLPESLETFFPNHLVVLLCQLPKKLCVFQWSNFKTKSKDLPNDLQILYMTYREELFIEYFPKKLKKLYLRLERNYIVAHDYPPYLESLTLYGDEEIPNDDLYNFPPSLKEIIFNNKFNKPINNLPNLIKLNLGNYFNHPIEDLPDSIEILIIGRSFDQIIYKLPKNLRILKLYNNNIIIKDFPKKLYKIYVRKNYKYINNIPKHIIVNYPK